MALRSRSSTCDSIQSGSSPSSSCNAGNRLITFPSAASSYAQPGTSPKQHNAQMPQMGSSSPSSTSSSLKNLTQTPTNSASRKSLVVTGNKMEVHAIFVLNSSIANTLRYRNVMLRHHLLHPNLFTELCRMLHATLRIWTRPTIVALAEEVAAVRAEGRKTRPTCTAHCLTCATRTTKGSVSTTIIKCTNDSSH